jgi:hypothetical protein
METLIRLPYRVINYFPRYGPPAVENYLVGVACAADVVDQSLHATVKVAGNVLVNELNNDSRIVLPGAKRIEDVASNR